LALALKTRRALVQTAKFYSWIAPKFVAILPLLEKQIQYKVNLVQPKSSLIQRCTGQEDWQLITESSASNSVKRNQELHLQRQLTSVEDSSEKRDQ